MVRSAVFNTGELFPFLTEVPQPVKVANFCKVKKLKYKITSMKTHTKFCKCKFPCGYWKCQCGKFGGKWY